MNTSGTSDQEVVEDLRNLLGINFGERPEKVIWAVKKLLTKVEDVEQRAEDAEAERDKAEEEHYEELDRLRGVHDSLKRVKRELDDLRDLLEEVG